MRSFARSCAVVVGALFLAGSLAPTDAFAKKKKGDDSEESADGAVFELIEIEETGIKAFDDVFLKAKGLNGKLSEANTNILTANNGIVTALGLKEGTPVSDAIAQLKKDAPGMFTVEMDGITPKVSVKPEAPDNVKAAVDAINTSVGALGGTAEVLAGVPGEAKDIIEAAKALPAQVPSIAKEAGLKASEIPALVKKVKNNTKSTVAIPGNTKILVDNTAQTIGLVKSLAE